MSSLEAWLIVVAAALVTYATRAVGIFVLAERRVPLVIERALRHVGPAVLAALVANIAAGDGGLSPAIDVPEAVALTAAAAVAWWRRNVLWSLGAGLSAFWIAMAVLG
ncbi:MAG: AzlD domain-containing protein [Actinomycetota bacterium]|nr:AzlD domain-containing protein [Actinomycetota bacterium]MDA3015414.1 AzlD domain-containing protein [Actinomycetota bacterium]MDA3027769.1 AzlD domain-containing protein [Actinomycetota bacterium]